MTDYSRAGPPGDHGLVSPSGGHAAPGSPNGGHPGHAPDDAVAALDPGLDDLHQYPDVLDDEFHDEFDDVPDDEFVDAPDDEAVDEALDGDLDDEDDDDDDDDDEKQGAAAGEPVSRILPPRAPVARRTMLVSVGTASAGLLALVVAVLFAVSGIGPLDRPLLISPVGLDGTPASTDGAVAAVPPKPGGKVPRVVGMTFARAKAIIEGAGFRVEARYQQGSQPRETVLAQQPAPGTELGRRGLVILVVSLGIVDGPITGPLPLPTSPPLTGGSPTTRRPPPTTRRPPGTTSKPTTTTPPTTPPTTAPPPTTEPPPPTTVVTP